jgi:rod shape determining protein RodA
MASNQINLGTKVDWTMVFLYGFLVIFGWMNIYATVFIPDGQNLIFTLNNRAGKQLMFIAFAVLIILILLFFDHRLFDSLGYIFYAGLILLMILTIFVAKDIKGSRSWLKFGDFSLQPAEFGKFVTALALAKYLSFQNINISKNTRQRLIALAIAFLPLAITVLQKEVGVALVFTAFLMVLYREGLSGSVLAVGMALVLVAVLTLIFHEWVIAGAAVLLIFIYFFVLRRYDRTPKSRMQLGGIFLAISMVVLGLNTGLRTLKKHHRNRIEVLVNPSIDPLGIGWNVTQSKIAISSGGIIGKGYREGTHTKFDFVPEQTTDYIFCTVGEEWGFLGSTVLIIIYTLLITRILNNAERNRNNFTRIYGYCVASILAFHVLINIGMTIGLVPTIGIPLPFMSYGGSSLWSFTILLFIFIKLDAHRNYKTN